MAAPLDVLLFWLTDVHVSIQSILQGCFDLTCGSQGNPV
jgi:hypothetical protein